MKLLLEISDKDVSNGLAERFDKPYTLRKAARAVVFNDNKKAWIASNTTVAVPEPSTYLILVMMLGFAALTATLRKRKRIT